MQMPPHVASEYFETLDAFIEGRLSVAEFVARNAVQLSGYAWEEITEEDKALALDIAERGLRNEEEHER